MWDGQFSAWGFLLPKTYFLGRESLENGVASLSPMHIYPGFLLLEKQCVSDTSPETCVPGLALIIAPHRWCSCKQQELRTAQQIPPQPSKPCSNPPPLPTPVTSTGRVTPFSCKTYYFSIPRCQASPVSVLGVLPQHHGWALTIETEVLYPYGGKAPHRRSQGTCPTPPLA